MVAPLATVATKLPLNGTDATGVDVAVSFPIAAKACNADIAALELGWVGAGAACCC